jgi:hypothetical protein
MRTIFILSIALISAIAQSVHAEELPGGSYKQTCFSCKVDARQLECRCAVRILIFLRTTAIELSRCPPVGVAQKPLFANDNGQLVCEGEQHRH